MPKRTILQHDSARQARGRNPAQSNNKHAVAAGHCGRLPRARGARRRHFSSSYNIGLLYPASSSGGSESWSVNRCHHDAAAAHDARRPDELNKPQRTQTNCYRPRCRSGKSCRTRRHTEQRDARRAECLHSSTLLANALLSATCVLVLSDRWVTISVLGT